MPLSMPVGIVMSAFAAVAFVVVVFQIISNQRERRRRYRTSRRFSPPPSPPVSPRAPRFRRISPYSPPVSPTFRRQSPSLYSSDAESADKAKITPAANVREQNETSSTLGSQDIDNQTIYEKNDHNPGKASKRRRQRKSRKTAEKLAQNHINNKLDNSFTNFNGYETESSLDSQSELLPKSQDELVNQTIIHKNVNNSNKTLKRRFQRKSKKAAEKSAQNHSNKLCECFANSNAYETESSSDSQSELLLKSQDELVNQAIIEENVNSSNKTLKRRFQRKSKKAAEKLAQNYSNKLYKCFANSDEYEFESSSDSSNFLSKPEDKLMTNSEEDNYKMNVQEALKRDLYNKGNDPNSSSVCSSKKAETEKFMESNFCRACEEKPVNTYAYPCNHFFLCNDCAARIFRLYKKCSICLEDVLEFIQFVS